MTTTTSTAINQLNVQQAVAEAIAEEMRRDPRVVMFGEGVATKRPELVAEFGAERVRNTPLAEAIIAGTAVGAAAMGMRPIVDLLFAPFLTLSMDALVNSAGKLRYLSGGQFSFPLVVLTMTGAGWGVGGQHNHNLEAMFVHAPGLKVVMPSNAADFKGLLKAAIRDDNPVLFFMDLALAHTPGDVPAGEHVVPLGRADVVREGIDLEVIDLRTLKPLDTATLLRSVRKTGRAMVVHEASGLCGVAAEVAAFLAEHAFDALKAPVARVTGPDAPAAASWVLEQAAVPQAAAIAARAMTLVGATAS